MLKFVTQISINSINAVPQVDLNSLEIHLAQIQ